MLQITDGRSRCEYHFLTINTTLYCYEVEKLFKSRIAVLRSIYDCVHWLKMNNKRSIKRSILTLQKVTIYKKDVMENTHHFEDNFCAHPGIECCGRGTESGSRGETKVQVRRIENAECLLGRANSLSSAAVKQKDFGGDQQAHTARNVVRRASPERQSQNIRLYCI